MGKKGNFGRHFCVICAVLFLSVCGLGACGKEKIEPGVPLQDLMTEYNGTEGNIKSIAVSKEGDAFVLSASQTGYRIYQFSEEGECLNTYLLEGYANIDSIVLTEDEETIYFAGQGKSPMTLFAFHMADGQIEEVCDYWYDIAQTKKIVLLGDKIYVMGQKKMSAGSSSLDRGYDFSTGNVLLCCSLEDGECSPMGFEYPVNIASGGTGTLYVFTYFPEEGYFLMEYDPKDASVNQKMKLDECRYRDFAVCNNGKSLLYDCTWSIRGLLLADIDEPDLEIEVYDESTSWLNECRVWYGNGRVYLEDNNQKLVSFPLDAVQKKNKTVRMVSTPQFSSIVPYGCGYRLEWLEEEWDKIVLKMLAQDQDYDLCLASSAYSRGIAMREGDVVYPLNDLPGIEEYFDRCFPYVREAATTEDGKIWMLPFTASTYAMMVHEERAAQSGLDLHDNMTLEEFAQMVGGLKEENVGMFYVRPEEVSSDFLNRYFWHNNLVQGGAFLKTMESLRVLHQREALLHPEGNVNQEKLLCDVENMLDYYEFGYFTRKDFSLYNIPKEKSTDKNNITLYYFAVNGKSKYREETLNYLADLIAYLMRRNDLAIFQECELEAGSVEEEIHRLFEDGEVSFAVDEDVYQKDYVEVFKSSQPLSEYMQELERRLQLYQKE